MFGKSMPVRVFSYAEGIDITINSSHLFNRNHISPDDVRNDYAVKTISCWAKPDDIYSENAVVASGEYLVTSMVIYTRSVSSKAVNMELNRKVRKYCEEHSCKFMPRAEKRIMKDDIIQRFLTNSPIVPTIVPVVIDPVKSRVYLFSLSTTVVDEFTKLFHRTIGEDLLESTFFDFIPENEEFIDPTEFGGRFLTWLWYTTETNSQKTYNGYENQYSVTTDDGITVVGDCGDTCVVKGDVREARNGVFNGKQVDKFSFILYFGYVTVPCVVWNSGILARIEFKSVVDKELDDIENAVSIITLVENTREFLSVAVEEFSRVYNDSEEYDALKKEIWNWSRGDVCIKSFSDV